MYQTYEQGQAQAMCDYFDAKSTDFNAVAASYDFITGYTETMDRLAQLTG